MTYIDDAAENLEVERQIMQKRKAEQEAKKKAEQLAKKQEKKNHTIL